MTQTPAQPKPKRTRATVRKRGPLLTAWIVVVAVFGVITAIQGVLAQSALGLATSAFVFVCAWGLWGWQRWAYFALLFAIIVVLGVLLLALLTSSANMVPFIIALAAGAVTVAIIQPRLSDFR